jgi:parallel beta-helix repeat protein
VAIRELLKNKRLRGKHQHLLMTIIAMALAVDLIVIASTSLLFQFGNEREPVLVGDQDVISAKKLYTAHAPISITGNEQFIAANGVIQGDGSASNPYIIRGWEIAASGLDSAAVLISGTDAYFSLEDCHLIHPDGKAIYIDSVMNGTIIDNTCTESLFGIHLAFSANMIVIRNNCSYNSYYGISLHLSHDNVISNNTCSFEMYTESMTYGSGIHLHDSSDNTLTNNSCMSNCWYGISLDHSNENVISDNTCVANNLHGIYILLSDSNLLHRNNCSFNLHGSVILGEEAGILLYWSDWNILSENVCSDNNKIGVALRESGHNTITSNRCLSNSLAGIYMDSGDENAQWNLLDGNTCQRNADGILIWWDSSNNTLARNNCSENSVNGIRLVSSTNNMLTDNSCSNNLEYGIHVQATDWMSNYVSTNNTIWNNTLIGNNGATSIYDPSHVQACDEGTGNWWNSSGGYGNYWSDWTTPDADWNGIVDLPYNISGDAGAKDYYPLTTSEAPIPEFSSSVFPVIIIVSVMTIVIGMRRRRDKMSTDEWSD